MPVTWETHWPLPDGRMSKNLQDRLLGDEPDPDADRRDQLIHTIGNLTLLTQPLNSSLQNGAWIDKQPEITKQSALALNREFLDYPEWNEARIEERGRNLLTHALEIWPRWYSFCTIKRCKISSRFGFWRNNLCAALAGKLSGCSRVAISTSSIKASQLNYWHLSR